MRKCGKCQQTGHNARTCGKPKKAAYTSRGLRQCSNCLQWGHNKRTCGSETSDGPTPRYVKTHGWLVNESKKRIAGQVVSINHYEGTTSWQELGQSFAVESETSKLERGGYIVVEHLPEDKTDWVFLNIGEWRPIDGAKELENVA